jgi:hypothetical protein
MKREMTRQEAESITVRRKQPAFWTSDKGPRDSFMIENNSGLVEVWWLDPEASVSSWQPCPPDKQVPEDGWEHREPCDCEFCR